MAKYKELIGAVFFVLFSVFYIVFSFSIPVRPMTTPRLVPQMAGGLILVLSLIHLIMSAIKLKNKPPVNSESNSSAGQSVSNYTKVVLTLLFLVLYIIGLSTLGFIISTFVFLIAQIFLLAPKEKRKPLPILLPAAICTGAIYFLFGYVFSVALPFGIF